MKYGLLYTENDINVGDDIQAYAAVRFLPRIDYLIGRDDLDSFCSDGGERVAAIFNAWFWNFYGNWPPANCVLPLPVSMHFNEMDGPGGLDLGLSILGGLGGDWLRRYGPVGCRDFGTLEKMKAFDIPAYYTGCLTLTLPGQPRVAPERDYVCIVDTDPAAEAYATQQAAAAGLAAEVMTHAVQPIAGWPQRVERLEGYLQKYQNARCVITTRLHCALPCLAMGVPVLFLCDDMQEYRVSNFLEHLHAATTADFCAGRGGFSLAAPPANKGTHLPLREGLIERAEDFIRRCEAGELDDTPMFAATALERQQWKTGLVEQRLRRAYHDLGTTREVLYRLREQVCYSGNDGRLSAKRLFIAFLVQLKLRLFGGGKNGAEAQDG